MFIVRKNLQHPRHIDRQHPLVDFNIRTAPSFSVKIRNTADYELMQKERTVVYLDSTRQQPGKIMNVSEMEENMIDNI